MTTNALTVLQIGRRHLLWLRLTKSPAYVKPKAEDITLWGGSLLVSRWYKVMERR